MRVHMFVRSMAPVEIIKTRACIGVLVLSTVDIEISPQVSYLFIGIHVGTEISSVATFPEANSAISSAKCT